MESTLGDARLRPLTRAVQLPGGWRIFMTTRILIVDDQQAQLNAMRRDLRGEKALDVHTTSDSNTAVRLINELSIDLLITDILMPDKEGLELVREVRGQFPHCKIIAMSGGGKHKGVDYLQLAQLFGASGILSKPFSKEDLIVTISKVAEEDQPVR